MKVEKKVDKNEEKRKTIPRKKREKEFHDKNEDDARKKKMIAFDNYKEM